MIANRQTDNAAEKPNARWYGRAESASGAACSPPARPPRAAIPCPAEIASTMADVPKPAQAWRTAMDSELPCGTSGRGRSARLHWVSGPMSSDTPHARTPWNTTACHNGEAAFKKHMGTAPAESTSPPTKQTRAQAIGQHAAERVEHERGDGARQQYHTRLKRRAAAQAFHIQRHHQRDAHEGGEQQVLRRETGVEAGRAEYAQIDERAFQALLAHDERHAQSCARDKRDPYIGAA